MKKQIIKSNSAFVAIGDPNALVSRTRANLLSYSNDFTNAIWNLVTSAPTITKNQIDPFGVSNNAWTFADFDAGNDASAIEQAINITASPTTNYTFSIFAKQGTASYFDIYSFFLGKSTKGSYVRYVWATDTFDGGGAEVDGAVPTNLKKTYIGNGWYRFNFTIKDSNDGTNTSLNFRIYPSGRNAGFTGTTIFYGSQIEISNFETDYINNISYSSSITEYVDQAKLFSLVQNCNFGVTANRTNLKQLGNQSYIVNDLIRAPDVNLSFDYYLTPYLVNESLIGLSYNQKSYSISNNLSKNNQNNNFYIIINNEEGQDGFDQPKRIDPQNLNFSGFDCLSFGNSYLKKYSLGFKLNEVPKASVEFVCSNMKFDKLIGNYLLMPSINFQSSYNSSNTGYLDLSSAATSLASGYVSNDPQSRTSYNPPVALSNNSQFILKDLQVGGVPLNASSYPILQSFDFSLDFNRVDLHGLGSNYVYNRKLQYPINGQVQIQALVSGFNSGFLSGMLYNETGYDFDINFSNNDQYITGSYNFKNAKLNNFSYTMPVNNMMTFSAAFSFQITENDGLFLSKTGNANFYWAGVTSLWNNININWNSV